MDMHGLDLAGINGISQVLTVHLCQHRCTPEATYCPFDPLMLNYFIETNAIKQALWFYLGVVVTSTYIFISH
jgi:hypothetical protein